jgi:hypothetical protein
MLDGELIDLGYLPLDRAVAVVRAADFPEKVNFKPDLEIRGKKGCKHCHGKGSVMINQEPSRCTCVRNALLAAAHREIMARSASTHGHRANVPQVNDKLMGAITVQLRKVMLAQIRLFDVETHLEQAQGEATIARYDVEHRIELLEARLVAALDLREERRDGAWSTVLEGLAALPKGGVGDLTRAGVAIAAEYLAIQELYNTAALSIKAKLTAANLELTVLGEFGVPKLEKRVQVIRTQVWEKATRLNDLRARVR